MAGEFIGEIRGNLGADPELKVTPNGKTVCNFSVGCTPRLEKDGQWVDGETTWVRVAIWDKEAEIAIDVLHKGTLVDIKGVVTNRKYTDKEGVEKTSLELSARKWAIVQTRKSVTVKESESSPWGN